MRRFGVAVGAVAVALAGCGGDDEAKPGDTVQTYLKAVADGDGEAACKQLTGAAKRQAVDALSAQVPELDATNCDDAISGLSKSAGEDEKTKLRDAKVTESISGNSATVKVEGGTQTAKLTKSGDLWLISGGLFDEMSSGAGGATPDDAPEADEPTDAAPDENSEATLKRVMDEYKAEGVVKASVVENAAAISVKGGTSASTANNLCQVASGALSGTEVEQIIVLSNADGNDLATCTP